MFGTLEAWCLYLWIFKVTLSQDFISVLAQFFFLALVCWYFRIGGLIRSGRSHQPLQFAALAAITLRS